MKRIILNISDLAAKAILREAGLVKMFGTPAGCQGALFMKVAEMLHEGKLEGSLLTRKDSI